nr:putative uncharacterized protein [Lactiplantibacillus pentosus IG1]
MYVSNAKINIANSNINESVWKTLIDCETFLKIIPCSHGPHLAREKTATALKTSCLIYYTETLTRKPNFILILLSTVSVKVALNKVFLFNTTIKV